MNSNDQIINIIQQFLDSKGNYDSLKPICIAHEDYVTAEGVKFAPHPDYSHKKGYVVKDDLRDDKGRIRRLTILNSDIEKYNEWAGDRPQYPNIDLYHPYSFLVIRDGYEDVDKQLYVEIVDEELYKLKEDEDFIPRFNKTIYDFLKYKKEELEAEGRWSDENIYYKPFQAFGDWFDKHPEHLLAPPYEIEGGIINVTDALWSVADDLRARTDKDEFPSYRDAYRWWCKRHTHKSKKVTWKSLENEYKKNSYRV